MEEKKCSKCKQVKPIEEFGKDKKTKDGYNFWCSLCRKKANAKYYKENLDHCREVGKKYRDLHPHIPVIRKQRVIDPNRHKETRRKYYKEHSKQMLECQKKYKKANKEQIVEYWRKYRKEHKDSLRKWRQAYTSTEKYKALCSKYRQTEKAKENAIRQGYKRRRLLDSCINDLTAEQWEEIKKRQNYACLHCGKKEPEIKLTRDHIIPVALGGHHTASNIQGLCLSCNTKKHTKIDSTGVSKLLNQL